MSDPKVPTLIEFLLGPPLFINLIQARRVRFQHAVENRPEHELLDRDYAAIRCIVELADHGRIRWWSFSGFGHTPEEAFAAAWRAAYNDEELPEEMTATSSLYAEFAQKAKV